MKKAVALTLIIFAIGITACGGKLNKIDKSNNIIEEISKDKEIETQNKEEKDVLKIEKHEEKWQSLLGRIGEIDWNANMPKVGDWGFYYDYYFPNTIIGDNSDPYFFMGETMVFKKEEEGIKETENVEELPELLMRQERHWNNMAAKLSTFAMLSDYDLRAVLKTQSKVTIDNYDFMRLTGDFEIVHEETKEVENTYKFIGYAYISVDPDWEENESHKTSSLENHMIFWCERPSEEMGDYNLIEETADKIMSTFKLYDKQREYWDKKKVEK